MASSIAVRPKVTPTILGFEGGRIFRRAHQTPPARDLLVVGDYLFNILDAIPLFRRGCAWERPVRGATDLRPGFDGVRALATQMWVNADADDTHRLSRRAAPPGPAGRPADAGKPDGAGRR
jgi:hypothetical protein